MFGCCCKSSSKTALIAALVGAAGIMGGALLTRALDENTPAAPADPAEVAPASYQPEQPEMDVEAMMAAMKDWAAPVEEHEMLQKMVGTWDCTAKFWMGPGEPTISKGASTSESILGGRFVSQHFTMPDMMGMPFEGMGAVGYDKAKGRYVTIWIDNFSTGFMMMEGECSEDHKAMTWTGDTVYPDGQGGSIEVPVKHVVHYHSDDHIVMEFWEPTAPGEELAKTGEIEYTRRKR